VAVGLIVGVTVLVGFNVKVGVENGTVVTPGGGNVRRVVAVSGIVVGAGVEDRPQATNRAARSSPPIQATKRSCMPNRTI